MFGKNCPGEIIFAALTIACLTAACALNVASSKLSYGDRVPAAEFPKRVAVATFVGNIAAQQAATDRLARGLVDLGFQVMTTNWNVDKVLGQWSGGISEAIPEDVRRQLEETYGLQGLFVGTLSQEKHPLINELQLSLRLISIPGGRLVWSAKVHGGGVEGLSFGVKERAVAATEKALHSLEAQVYSDPKRDPKGNSQTSSASQVKRNQSEKSH